MTRTSWFKKIWKGRSKGVSTVIGTVFLILIIFMVSTNVLLWTFSQNALYTQAEKDVNQDEADRRNENVVATDGNYSVSVNQVTVEVTLTNTGAVAVQIINLWVFDTSIQTYNYTSLNLNLNPGNVTDLTGENAIMVTIDGADSAHDFISWFVTARGNTIPLEEEQEQSIIEAQVSKGIGSVAMDFASFKYYNVSEVDGSYILDNYTDGGAEGYVVPADKYIAFEVVLTNYDKPDEREIKLFSGSILWALFPVMETQPRCAWWYIVNVVDNGTHAIITKNDYTTIKLTYGVPKKVFFASANDLNSEDFTRSKASSSKKQIGPAAVNLMLVGQIGTSTYGQNVPFVSIYFTP